MANWIYSGRRSGRTLRSRHESEDEVRLDFCKDANDNTREILTNICKKEGLTEGKRFNYLNEFVKLLIKLEGPGSLDYSIEELQCCLRVALIHEASLVRAATLRAVRYLLKEEKDVRILNRLGFPALICRSLDLVMRNDMERVQALQLVRRMLLLAPTDVTPSIVRSLVSLASSATEEKDRMLRPCLAALSEICILNPELFISCGGVGTVLSGLEDNQMPRITESLCGVLLCLLNSPATRSKAGISLQSLAAPYCDFRLYTDRNREERENLFYCSKLALLSILRSWPGVLHFCHPANSSGLKSLVNILYLNQLDVRKGILDLLYDLLGLPQPEWTDEFSVALEAVDPSHPRDAWKLQDGFISAEGKDVLPHLAKYRPNIVEMHLALLLYTFMEAGLLEAIVEVIVSSDTYISVRATVLLGELLYLIHKLLPPECCNLTPALPNLLSYAADPTVPCTQNLALAAVAALARLHTMLKRRPAPASLFLDRTLQAGGWSRTSKRSKLFMFVAPKENDDLLKESAVLTHKDGFSWNWNIVRTVLKNRSDALKKLEDSNHRMFLRRLVHYFKPSSNRFSRVELGNKKQTQMYTLAGLELIDCLLEADEAEGMKLLTELVSDICTQIEAITSSKSAHDCLFSPQHMSSSVCQDYFLFIGRLCRCSKGSRLLDKTGIYQELLHLVGSTNHDCYIKLVVSGLDYSQDAMPRAILSKVLTAAYESARLYATQFLLVLLRAKLPDFEKWGIELLVMQLYDKSKAVSLAAIHVLEEAAEEKTYLDAIISLRPSLLHLGDRGLLLLIRFLSIPNGFTFLHDANFVTTQLERWAVTYNYRYVRLVEGEIHSSLTLHQRDEDGRYSRHISNVKPTVRDVFIPPHLYGQLVQHERGFQLLLKEGKLQSLFQNMSSEYCPSEQDELDLKASIWGCGHIGTSPLGVSYLIENGIIQAVVQLAQNCPIYSIRATAFYALGLIATTYEGANHLNKAGWLCVRHHRQDRWPVIHEENNEPEQSSDMDNISVSSQLTAAASSSVEGRRDSNLGKFYIPGDDEVDSAASGDDEPAPVMWPLEAETKKDASIQKQNKSQTLPHQRSARSQTMLARHVRSHSECKQTNDDGAPFIQTTGWTYPTNSRTRKDSARGDQETKSRSNSCTDSSGVSSCDSGVGVVNKHEQTLSPIPSSTTLNTTNVNQVVFRRRMSSMNESITSDSIASAEPTSCYLSQQDITGYATLRSLYQYRRPLYSETVSLAAMEFLVFNDHAHSSQSVSRALKVRSLDRHSIHPGMCEFEASLPPQLPSGASSLPLAAHAYIGSRSNLAAVKHSTRDMSGTHQCYMGICLPRDLKCLYPSDEVVDVSEDCERSYIDNRRGNTHDMSHEKGEGDKESSSSSDSEDLESQIRTYQSGADYHHVSVNCLACCRLRDRKISASSYHRSRTDTESSYGGGESPVLLPKRRKSYSTSICLLGITPGGSVESGNSASLDTGSCNQRLEEAGTPSKASIRKEILRHVVRMSNPVWIKLSKQSLLQLKEKFPAAFQDVCLYSEVSHQMGLATYRLSARRFLQELFLDLQFDVLYEEPGAILQMQPSGTEGGSTVGIGSPQSTDLSYSLPASPNVSVSQDIRDKITTQTSLETCHPVSPPSSYENPVTSEMESESLSKTLDTGTRVSVLQGTYTVKSPPLEVVKEESVASVSHLDTLSEQSLLSSSSSVFVSARNDVLISAIMSDSPVSCVVDKRSSQLTSRDKESVAVSVALVTTSNTPVLDCYKFQSSSRTNSTPLKGKEEIKSDLTVNFSLADVNCDRTKTADKRKLLNASVLPEGGMEQSRRECVWRETSPAGFRQRKMATTHAPKLSSLSTDNAVPSSNTGNQVS